MTRTPLLALSALVLAATGLAGVAAPATAVGAPSIRPVHAKVETGKKAVLVGKVPGAARGSHVVIQDRFSPRQLWVTVGHATVGKGGAFRYTQLLKRPKSVYFRVCAGPNRHRRCSASVKQTVLLPDGDPKAKSLAADVHPFDPLKVQFGAVSLLPFQLKINKYAASTAEVSVEAKDEAGHWFKVGLGGPTNGGGWSVLAPNTGRDTVFRAVLAPTKTTRRGVSNTFSSRIWALQFLEKLHQSAGAPVSAANSVDIVGINVFTSRVVTVPSGSATFQTPDNCQTMYLRAGVVPAGGMVGDQRHATVTVDGNNVLATDVSYAAAFSSNPELVVPLAPGVHQVTFTDAFVAGQPTGKAGFDARFDCLNGPTVSPF